ncbi:MOSC domain-containing protein [Parerythrobacter jejuensis]|uniref:MOSC domain-containing protein n=1 Tax=Parerythrobacter jejuensis TaxID=795812 RepID=A0A845B113_9SPHN|nr:MOSC domain-containing protein [Parerythrobacter jejuensis]MXP32678.1 MOSC domain-containing protein [Parerythrobacter jejuensis]
MKPVVDAICVGTAKPFRDGEQSAFAKEPVAGPVAIGAEGLVGDTQADRKHHGGPHMAVHLYPRAHHVYWEHELGGHDVLALPGAFGTNLSVDGICERDVYLGDRFQLGEAVLEISQPRLPCWKIEHRFDRKGMVAKIIATGRSGWYFRVIQQGVAESGQRLERVETGRTPWTIEQVFLSIVNPKSGASKDDLLAMADCDLLSPSWRDGAAKKASAL